MTWLYNAGKHEIETAFVLKCVYVYKYVVHLKILEDLFFQKT